MVISIIPSLFPAYGATVFYANGAFTQNGIEWCEENQPLYELLGEKFFEHHRHSIESRVCANLIEDELWNYSGPDRVKKLIERSMYFSQLEISESKVEAGQGVLDPTPAEVPDRKPVESVPEIIQHEQELEQEKNLEEIQDKNQEGGGCLIATAAFGSELSNQVQMLREIRDTKVINTQVGSMFILAFNQFYYSFSPTIADMERTSPMFKEIVKIFITPLLSSLSILNYVDINSDTEMLITGVGIIFLNTGIYFVIPIIASLKFTKLVSILGKHQSHTR